MLPLIKIKFSPAIFCSPDNPVDFPIPPQGAFGNVWSVTTGVCMCVSVSSWHIVNRSPGSTKHPAIHGTTLPPQRVRSPKMSIVLRLRKPEQSNK